MGPWEGQTAQPLRTINCEWQCVNIWVNRQHRCWTPKPCLNGPFHTQIPSTLPLTLTRLLSLTLHKVQHWQGWEKSSICAEEKNNGELVPGEMPNEEAPLIQGWEPTATRTCKRCGIHQMKARWEALKEADAPSDLTFFFPSKSTFFCPSSSFFLTLSSVHWQKATKNVYNRPLLIIRLLVDY